MSYKKEIVELRKQDKTYNEIKEELGCSKGTISYHCKNEGLEDIGKKNHKLSDEKIEQIRKMRKQEGYTYDEIEKAVDVSKSAARKYGKSVEKGKSHPDSKTCRTCEEEKPIAGFYEKSDRDGHYNQCKTCRNKSKSKRGRKYKKQLVEYLGGRCEKCGYDKCYSALEFHHKNPSKKKINVSRSTSYSFQKLKEEADKCSLLCANCHREVECGRKMCNH